MRLAALLLAGALLAAAEQPVLLPLPELMKALDPAREWLLLPQADVQALESAAKLAPAPPASGAFLASASVRARVVDGREVVFTADFTACNRGDGPALAALFAAAPARLGAISLGGQPAVLAPGAPLRLLLPRAGRFAGTLGWSVPLDGDIQRRSERLPLPLAGGLSLQLAGDGRGTAVAAGLVRDGDGWRLAAPAGTALDLAWLPGGSGDGDAPLFGAEQTLTVQMQDGPRPLRWEVRLEARRGSAPATLLVTLPPGFTCTAAQAGVAQLAATAEGLAITRAADAPLIAIDGLLAPGAPVALPRIAGAAWQGGTVALAGDRALACDPPAGWRPRGGSATARSFAVAGPDAGMAVTPLAADAGLAVATSTAVAVGPQRATLDQVLTVRAGGTRLFRLPLQLPAGWRATALRGEGALVPAVEDLAPGAALAVELPGGLAPGAELSLLL
ncbi:MAG: hypothetical protein L6R48_24940, partial [Planctomycetes bacterium]|nr:hypothetical protein [Planctomycetota bacterium]